MIDLVNLPSDVEAERSVLGVCFLSDSTKAVVTGSLSEGHFTDNRNKLVFRAMKELNEKGLPLDSTTMLDQLIQDKSDEEVGGTDYLLCLVDGVVSADNADHYIKILKDLYTLRNYLLEIQSIEKEYASGPIKDAGTFVSVSHSKLTTIANSRPVEEFKTANDYAEAVRTQLQTMSSSSNGKLLGVDTGYEKLNVYTHGWKPGELIIVAGRPSMGKTAFALNLAYNGAVSSDVPVAIFSAEMDGLSLMKRIYACRAMVSMEHIQTGYLSSSEKVKIASAYEEIKDTKIYIDDTPNISLGDLVAKATKLKATKPDLGLIVIDYLGIIGVETGKKNDSREREVALITKTLKSLARDLNVPIILICQINRKAEDNDGNRPQMSNLRESGSIEADADIVCLLYNEDYYLKTGASIRKKGFKSQEGENKYQAPQPKQIQADGGACISEVIVAKNRNGKTGTVKLIFSKEWSRFDNTTKEYDEAEAKFASGDSSYLE